MNKALTELKECLASLEKQAKELKAQISSPGQDPDASPESTDSKIKNLSDYLYNVVGGLHRSLNSLAEDMYSSDAAINKKIEEHTAGHPPKPHTASQMQAYLKACNMSGDYEIQKPGIYMKASNRPASKVLTQANASRRGVTYEVNIEVKKNS